VTKVTDAYGSKGSDPVVICDFSPPRGPGREFLDDARKLDVDFLSVAYNPGKAVRVDSAMLAYAIKDGAGRDAIFSLATRDMNRLALESHLLGAGALGMENLLVIGGDPFSPRDLERVKNVRDFRPTELIEAVNQMNQGLDFRGRKLRQPTDLCVGGAIDLGRDQEAEARLTYRKVRSGAHFLITQPIFDVADMEGFRNAYRSASGEALDIPVFWGLQIMVDGGVIFSSVPEALRRELEGGRDGVDIALEQWVGFKEAGVDAVYLVPPILKGGARDYDATSRFLGLVK
jgi:5,10-methylenetetrahydrofolate reductase